MKQNLSFWWRFYLLLYFISFLFSEWVAVLLDVFTKMFVSIFLGLGLFLPLFLLLTIPTYKIYYWAKSRKRTFWLFLYPALLVLPFAILGFLAYLSIDIGETWLLFDLCVSWIFYVVFTNLMVVLFLPKKITKRRGDVYLWIGVVGWIAILGIYFLMS